MATARNIPPESLTAYRATARQRWAREQEERTRRWEEAWGLARRAAALLKEQFGATRVVLFGSLAHGRWFSPTSDVDLAAWGLAPADFFTAVARLQDLAPGFEVDLVMAERCPPHLWQVIEKEGISL
ncbi:nucleotidyltransferase domain-containing protein [Litorilinea aerophila]|uniref:Nucleotidyltransferase domain-containing protein n=1 Tax=Litorilinea aerophila TaxID=1204385 RepID=A0A540V945_9CHLR|nr:nucleotidyltransferase domain-containing protein [Litorilinea aerophila]MCC9078792.1 nucleotidyltransferase domain-containing protein [Litorilinea aerophila]OUC07070.1 hypothetical protein RY27_17140 [Litorilinea aerophila]